MLLASNLVSPNRCSLAYGTPLQIHRAQYDVPFPTVNDLCAESASPDHRAAASVFVALATLTEVLACYLEHVYSVAKDSSHSGEPLAIELEQTFGEWEESLSDDIRQFVLRGTNLDVPGSANFRLAYLAVKLLLRRIQLDLTKRAMDVEDDTSPFYLHAQRAAEEIVLLVQELDETQLRGFWIPVHAFSLTSATMFLLRSGLRWKNQHRNRPLRIARDMAKTLQAHRRNFDWDLADYCLDHCGDLIEKISMTEGDGDVSLNGIPDFSDNRDIDAFVLGELFFDTSVFTERFEF